MSKQAHQFPTSALVFNDIRVRGVAIGIWVRQGNQDEFMDCLNDLQVVFYKNLNTKLLRN